ncbi:lipoprotein insertase outer membrane protein LolB [Geomesophilobacter sediminis]|uniref:Outer-membrane lipoprotein LolB n=1 Tax=Geomesophilobacter sediminis TaxID=2798584 RepID=A0A8J7M0U6_9BACT|nr:lipoprotein insertase outer membrane protein LolB [Geomesophilobacter sediminis]MBJ6726537.1 outer membrane lipoprotein LolB [Geomesophilobacter sediminis]
MALRQGKRFLWGIAALLLFLGGCVTAPPPVKVIPGASVDTLSSSVAVSAKGRGHSGSAHGFLLFQRPNRLHVVFLAPFGSTVFELFMDDDRLTCLVPDKKTAYAGRVTELPPGDYLATLRLMRWVLARPPVPGPSLGAREMESEEFGRERIFFMDNGLVQRKVAPEGEEVIYRDYRMVDGVPFPEKMEIHDGKGGEVKITFEDPEVNHPIEPDTLIAKLDGYQVLPLVLLQGAP